MKALVFYVFLFHTSCSKVWCWSYMQQSTGFLRQAPFCVDVKNFDPYDEKLHRFHNIFDHHNQNSYITVSPDGKSSPTGIIKNFEIKAITVNDRDSGYKDTLRNWLHIKIESEIFLQGLYVQAISLPWGVPFGEFVADFDCGDCSEATSKYKQFINIIPCVHRPALAFTHPNVFTVGAQKGKLLKTKFKEIHFNFKYTQYPCAEHTYAQFLIIAVRNFHKSLPRFETFLTGVYEMDIIDNEIGAHFPFYHGWRPRDLACHISDVGSDFKLYSQGTTKMKLRYSQPFDECVMKKDGKDWYTCPPGPVQLKSPPIDAQDWKTRFRDKYKYPSSSLPMNPDVQLCYDCGTWEWTVGKPSWSIPPTQWASGTFPVNSTMIGEDDNYDDCANAPSGPDTAPQCNELEEIPLRYCTPEDAHSRDCEIDPSKPPKYGKDLRENRITQAWDWDTMSLSEQFDDIAWRWGQKSVLRLHGELLIFSWTVVINVLTFIARFTKENTPLKIKSSFFGIGNWLWYHITWTYIHMATSFCGIFLVSFHFYSSRTRGTSTITGVHDLCNIRDTQEETYACVRTVGHQYCGVFAIILFLMSYVSAWERPLTPGLRLLAIIYHVVSGYFAKIFGFIALVLVSHAVSGRTVIYIVLTEFFSLVMFVVATIINSMGDQNLKIQPSRKIFPVPEGVDIFEDVRCKNVRQYLLLIHILIQFLVFIISIIDSG